MNREQAVERVNALLRMTVERGATPAEEKQARNLAVKIIEKYGLGEGDIDPEIIDREKEDAFDEAIFRAVCEMLGTCSDLFAKMAESFAVFSGTEPERGSHDNHR